MKRIITAICLMLTAGICLSAKDGEELRFDSKGEFKIVQFTDTHFVPGNPKSDIALERIDDVLRHEKPDLVVLTGDIIFSQPADVAIRTVLETISRHDIPFVITFGNHDREFLLDNAALYDIARTIPNNILPDRGETESPDFVLTVKDRKGNDAALIYCFDSHSDLPDKMGYQPMTFGQVEWYRNTSASYTSANGGRPVPAVTFMHIPFPEFEKAAHDDWASLIGHRMEPVCCSNFNSGMFNAMRECGDIMGVFVGHEHNNDYAVLHWNIVLAYGRYTGGDTVYNNLPNGARVIVLKEGERSFDSWIVTENGKRELFINYPESFIKR